MSGHAERISETCGKGVVRGGVGVALTSEGCDFAKQLAQEGEIGSKIRITAQIGPRGDIGAVQGVQGNMGAQGMQQVGENLTVGVGVEADDLVGADHGDFGCERIEVSLEFGLGPGFKLQRVALGAEQRALKRNTTGVVLELGQHFFDGMEIAAGDFESGPGFQYVGETVRGIVKEAVKKSACVLEATLIQVVVGEAKDGIVADGVARGRKGLFELADFLGGVAMYAEPRSEREVKRVGAVVVVLAELLEPDGAIVAFEKSK